jgi:hypothetical protein
MRVKRDIPVEVFIPENQYIDYADAFSISNSDQEFIISFLQLQYPITMTQEQLDKIKIAESVCIARIALTPKRMRILLQAIQENLRSYIEDRVPKKTEQATKESAAQEDK